MYNLINSSNINWEYDFGLLEITLYIKYILLNIYIRIYNVSNII